MSYIGNTPTQQNFVAGADQFSGNGSTTAFTLSRNVNTVFDIFVAISNVPQDPYSAYSVSGNTLTFTSAPPSGTGNIYVTYRATNVQTFVPTPGVSAQFGLGSAAAPSMTFIGNTTTGVFSPATNTLAFSTNGTEDARFDSSGNFGIGTTSPANKLHVVSSGDRALKVTSNSDTPAVLTSSGSANAYLQMSGSADVYLGSVAGAFTATTGGSERMRIDTSGNVGIGSTSITRAYANYNQLNLNGTSGSTIQMQAGGTSYANFVADSNALYVQGQTALVFGTSGSGTGTERARINSSGNFLIGTASTFDVTAGAVTQVSGAFAVYTAGSPNTLVSFYNSTQSARVGFIGSSGNSTQYNSGSDYRLKDNVTNMSGALSKISDLRPVTFTWKAAPEVGLVSGFIAHELDEVVPEAVSGEKDAMCDDGVTPNYQMVDQSKLVPLLVAAIQELNAKVEAQAAEIAALKGAA